MSDKRRIELFMTCFGAHLPDGPPVLQDQNVYPISVAGKGGLDLDYSSLLVVDEIIIDKLAYDVVHDSGRPYLKPMRESIRVLESEGLLRTMDFGGISRSYADEIRTTVDSLLDLPEYWLSTARQHWKLYKSTIPDLIKTFGANTDPVRESLPFGIYCYQQKCGTSLGGPRAQKLQALLESGRTRLSREERVDLREIVRPMLAYTLLNYRLREHMGTPFLDWKDVEPYYKKLSLPFAKNPDEAMISATSSLFELALPELRPGSIREAVKFIKKRSAVVSLRAEVQDVLRSGRALDRTWSSRVRDEANLAQIGARNRSRVISWVGSVLGLFLPGASLLAELAKTAGTEVVEEAAGELVSPKGIKRFEWYYSLLQTKGI